MVKVETSSFTDIFKNFQTISVPEYQRPYRWNVEKAGELLDDFEEFFIKQKTTSLEYYMGSILFFNNIEKNELEIIDGQQRLTTLILLQYVLEGKLLPNQNLRYNSHISFHNIQEIKNYFFQKNELLNKLKTHDFLSKLRFTIIISDNEDNAFAFFDSQNNRGVSLSADDYLKAYHLRAVSSEELQEQLAHEWEQIAFKAQKENNIEASLLHLFYKILYRSRKWQGQSHLIPEHKEIILKTFQKQTHKSKNKNHYPLFQNKNNIRFKGVNFNAYNEVDFVPNEKNVSKKEQMPFALRQPLYKGLNFFQFTQKYYSIHRMFFSDIQYHSNEINKTKEFYNKIYTSNMSVFLRHYMQLCLVMYYDTFGDNQLSKAAYYFDYFIGSIRIEKYYVREEAVKNSLIRSSTNNLLDVIANGYLPEEIFDFIMAQHSIIDIYNKENLDNDNGVRNQYKQRVMRFFEKEEATLKNRLLWIV